MDRSPTHYDLGRHLAKLRRSRGWTQARLHEISGVSIGVIAKIEQGGNAKMDSYQALANTLGVVLMFVPQGSQAASHGSTALSASSQTPGRDAAEWLAFRLWRQGVTDLHVSDIPKGLVGRLALHPYVVDDGEGHFRFTEPALIDTLVAQHVFGEITAGKSCLLSTGQTTHATDLAIGSMAGQDPQAQSHLKTWMQKGASAVLRVNAAGVLAKVGTKNLGDAVISALKTDEDSRQLYLTAVASRVLSLPWNHAAAILAGTTAPSDMATPLQLPPEQHNPMALHLIAELENQRDAGARWCSALLLGRLATADNDLLRSALGKAIAAEACTENLRTFAAVLAGRSPF